VFNDVVKDGENEGYCVKCEPAGAKIFSDQLFQALGASSVKTLMRTKKSHHTTNPAANKRNQYVEQQEAFPLYRRGT
jgi:hypothetical protein